MARFEKTRLHVVSAVLLLVGLYALAGLAHAAWIGAGDAMATWAVVAALALLASFAFQQRVGKKKRPTP